MYTRTERANLMHTFFNLFHKDVMYKILNKSLFNNLKDGKRGAKSHGSRFYIFKGNKEELGDVQQEILNNPTMKDYFNYINDHVMETRQIE